MAVYKVLVVPDETLRSKSKAVEKINDGVLRVLDNMRDTLYAENGLGLAAPQIGILKRLVVIDVDDEYMELINPVMLRAQGEQTHVEGCLSVPGVSGMVKRAEQVLVTALDRTGKEINIEGTGLLARALQHEIDHLNGIVFTDRAIEVRSEPE